ncbi:hypothetical protein McanMca71_000958 [Microsporum canis]
MWTSTSTKDRRSQPEFKIGYPKRLLWDEFEQSEPEYFPIPKFRELVPRRSYSPTPTFSSHRIYSSDYETLLYPPALSSSLLHTARGSRASLVDRLDSGYRCLRIGCGRSTQLGSYYCSAHH